MLVNVRVFKGKYKYAITAKRDNVILLTVIFFSHFSGIENFSWDLNKTSLILFSNQRKYSEFSLCVTQLVLSRCV